MGINPRSVVMAVKYKHGRVGVKRKIKALSATDAMEHYDNGWAAGCRSGLLKGFEVAQQSRTIKECRTALQELVDASA